MSFILLILLFLALGAFLALQVLFIVLIVQSTRRKSRWGH